MALKPYEAIKEANELAEERERLGDILRGTEGARSVTLTMDDVEGHRNTVVATRTSPLFECIQNALRERMDDIDEKLMALGFLPPTPAPIAVENNDVPKE